MTSERNDREKYLQLVIMQFMHVYALWILMTPYDLWIPAEMMLAVVGFLQHLPSQSPIGFLAAWRDAVMMPKKGRDWTVRHDWNDAFLYIDYTSIDNEPYYWKLLVMIDHALLLVNWMWTDISCISFVLKLMQIIK